MLEEFFEDGEGEDVGAFNVEMIRSGEIKPLTNLIAQIGDGVSISTTKRTLQ